MKSKYRQVLFPALALLTTENHWYHGDYTCTEQKWIVTSNIQSVSVPSSSSSSSSSSPLWDCSSVREQLNTDCRMRCLSSARKGATQGHSLSSSHMLNVLNLKREARFSVAGAGSSPAHPTKAPAIQAALQESSWRNSPSFVQFCNNVSSCLLLYWIRNFWHDLMVPIGVTRMICNKFWNRETKCYHVKHEDLCITQ